MLLWWRWWWSAESGERRVENHKTLGCWIEHEDGGVSNIKTNGKQMFNVRPKHKSQGSDGVWGVVEFSG